MNEDRNTMEVLVDQLWATIQTDQAFFSLLQTL